MEEAFLKVIEADPTQEGPKLRYADWLDEQGRGSDGDAMRWLAVKGIWPRKLVRYYWESKWNINPSQNSILPEEILSAMSHPIVWLGGHSQLQDAIGVFFQAWRKATAPPSWFWRLLGYKAWVPDYSEPKLEWITTTGY